MFKKFQMNWRECLRRDAELQEEWPHNEATSDTEQTTNEPCQDTE